MWSLTFSNAGTAIEEIDHASGRIRDHQGRWHGPYDLVIVAEGSAGFPKRVQAYAQRYGVDPNEVGVVALAAAPDLGDKADDALLRVLERDHHAIEKMLPAFVVEDAEIDQGLARVARLGHRVEKRSVAEAEAEGFP